MHTDVRTDQPAEDVEHAGDVLVRRGWVQFTRVHEMEYRESPVESRQSVLDY